MRGTKEPVNSNVDSMPNRTFDLEIGEVVVIERRAVPIQCYSPPASSTDASNSNKTESNRLHSSSAFWE